MVSNSIEPDAPGEITTAGAATDENVTDTGTFEGFSAPPAPPLYAPGTLPPTWPDGEVLTAPSLPPTPDNPPWGVATGALVWVGSIVLLLGANVLGGGAYLLYRLRSVPFAELQQTIATEPGLILVSLASVVPAHLVTLALVWAVVTNFGKRSFREVIGWSWGARWGFWESAGVAGGLWLFGILLANLTGGQETDLDRMIASSRAASLGVAFLATVSAPLVEETVYRGVLFPALRRAAGATWAIIIVSALFALVHVVQYRNNVGVIAAVAVLSVTLTLVRARTGRLLPCFVIHFLFNGIQSVLIVLKPYLETLSPAAKPTATDGALLQLVAYLFGGVSL